MLLGAYEPIKAGQGRLVEVITGFVDPNAPDEIAQPQNPKVQAAAAAAKGEEESDDDADGDEEPGETGPDPEEAARRFASLAKLSALVAKGLDEKGAADAKVAKSREKLVGEFMELKLAPKMFDALIDNLRDQVALVRGIERVTRIFA